jgi:hypothetical protein
VVVALEVFQVSFVDLEVFTETVVDLDSVVLAFVFLANVVVVFQSVLVLLDIGTEVDTAQLVV